jgi:C1A family cysteine protease
MHPSRVVLFAAALLIGTAAEADAALPLSVDWRSSGAVSSIMNMGQCGADWAFAATAAIEGARVVKGLPLQALSQQELIDCSGVDGNHGCSGGSPANAFQWVVRHGLTTGSQYPYTARDGSCKYGASSSPIHITSYRSVANDMASLMAAVAAQPVAVSIEAGADFHAYGGGIYACHPAVHPNYWVALVGYGTDSAGRHYWLVKNSNGTGWGEHGYMRMSRSADCHNIGQAFVAVP